ncbi:MAG: hypothetical protein ABS35_21425 [Kaistia sp. SCN 65-12]|nr:MAG: hypothetical protein ABS35_21425 [Kaistia sp. SCN 65-12]
MAPATAPEIEGRLVAVELDGATLGRASADVDHERKIAIYDLIEDNRFTLPEHSGSRYRLHLSIRENRLVFDVRDEADQALILHALSLTPLRKIVRDYFLICDSYYAAIRTATPSQIETIDMGRRGVHDDGSRLLMQRLAGKILVDFETARRLFTLICALHWKG